MPSPKPLSSFPPGAPRVSILIPCYNAERWLAQTLECAVQQSWPHKEILVVDDGSRDGSLELARSWSDRGVAVISQENGGASAARNRALQASRGQYIQFLDADDLISPDKLERQVLTLENRAGDLLASCRWGRFFEGEGPEAARFVDSEVFRDFNPLEYLRLHLSKAKMMHPSAWLVPRRLADKAGPWNEALSVNDDGEYFCRVVLASAGIQFVDQAESYYRSGVAGSLSRQRTEEALESQLRSLELCRDHLLRADDSAASRQALADAFQRALYDLYPAPAPLLRRAEENLRLLGGSGLKPEFGPLAAKAARLLGWKGVRRLQRLFGRRP